MKHYAIILFSLTLASVSLQANQRAQGYCMQGGQVVVTSGLSSTTKVQQSYPTCTVTVFLTGTNTLATIYSDNSNTPLSNPFSASATGLWFWYAANGRYDVQLSGGGIPSPFTIGDILLADPAGGGTTVSSITAGAGISTNASTGAVTVTNTWGAVPSGSQSQYLQIQPNVAGTVLRFNPMPWASASDYTWSQSLNATVSIGSNTVTVAPCPIGFSSAIASNGFYFHLSGGTGSPTPEDDLITATTCTSGAASGAVTFTAGVARTGTWTASSSYGGIIEAAYGLGSNGGSVIISPGTITFTAQGQIPYGNTAFVCPGAADNCIVRAAAGSTFNNLLYAPNINNVTIDGLTLDSNFINTSASYQRGLYANTVNGLVVKNSHILNTGYTGAPAYNSSNYSNSAGILCTACNGARIFSNRFNSDWCADIFGTGDGVQITDNQLGVPELSQVGTVANYWDTQSGGVAGVFWKNSNGVTIARNTIWGANRFYTPSFAVGNPIVTYSLTYSNIEGNTINGMTPVPGTFNVTNGSPTITASKSVFSTVLDPNAGIECETAVGTIFKISTVNSATSITLTSNYTGSSLSNARCRLQAAGDHIQTNGLQYSRIVGNSSVRSSDMGIDLNMFWDGVPADNVNAFQNIVANNNVSDAMVCGLVLTGQVQNTTVTGNVLTNNHRGTNSSSGGRGAVCMEGSFDAVHYYVQTGINFTGNAVLDTTGGGTQLYFIDIDTATWNGGYIGSIALSANSIIGTPNTSNEPIGQDVPTLAVSPGGVAWGPLLANTVDNSNTTSGAQTYTAAQFVGSPAILRRDPVVPATDVTPTATLIMGQIGQNMGILGTGWDFYLRNTSGGANTITLTGGTGVTLSGTLTVPQNQQRQFHCYVTNAVTPTVTCYSMGTVTY